MRKLVLAVLTFCVSSFNELAAQSCDGFAPFSAGMVGAGTSAFGGKGARAAGASLTVGKSDGLYGGMSLSTQRTYSYELGTFSSESPYTQRNGQYVYATAVGAQLAHESLVGAARKWSICPGVSFGYTVGPDESRDEFRLRHRNVRYGAGLAVGRSLRLGHRVQLVPNSAFGITGWNVRSIFGGRELSNRSGHAFNATIGAGFLMADRYSIEPWISLSSQEDADPVYGLSFRAQLGKKM